MLTNDQYAILAELADTQDYLGLTEREIEEYAHVRRGRSLNQTLEELLDSRHIKERHVKGHLFPTHYVITSKGRAALRE